MWQAKHVAALLRAHEPNLAIEFVELTTSADRDLSVPIAQIGGKGVFAKEIQQAVLGGRADLAVHSAKDLPASTIDGLTLAGVPKRGDARDGLAGSTLDGLAHGATVGTGSARRAAQLRALRPDLSIVGLRGNIAKRLSRLGELDAIVVAVAALERLELQDRLNEPFDTETFVPQVAQGALAIECRSDDDQAISQVLVIEDQTSRLCVDAERSFLARLGGDCDLPAGAHATISGDVLRLVGVLAPNANAPMSREEATAPATLEGAQRLGALVAQALLDRHDQ